VVEGFRKNVGQSDEENLSDFDEKGATQIEKFFNGVKKVFETENFS
jgi:hypothetical protein